MRNLRPVLLLVLFVAAAFIEALETTMDVGGYAPSLIARTLAHTACLFAPIILALAWQSRSRRGVIAETVAVAATAFVCAVTGQFIWGLIASRLRWFFEDDRALYVFDSAWLTATRLVFRRFEDPLLIAFVPILLGRLGTLRWAEDDVDLRRARVEARLSSVRLELLRSQINPHFVFNALNSIATLATRDPGQAKEMLRRLSSFHERAERTDSMSLVTVDEELHFVREYLEIERVRFVPRLSVDVDLDAGCGALLVPPLLLQPFVENAVKHGVSRARGQGWIRISVACGADRLRVVIENAGDASAPEPREGVGLANSRRRMAELFHNDFSLEIERIDDITRVTVLMPVLREERPAA